MAVTTDPFTGTDLAGFIPEVWTPIVNNAIFTSAVFSAFVTDLSPYGKEMGDIFHVPNLYTNEVTVSTQSTQGAEITTASPAQTDTTLTVDTHKYVALLFGDKDIAQMNKMLYDYNKEYADQAGRKLVDALESSLAGLWSSLTTNSVGDTATVLADLEVRQSVRKLDALFYDLDQVAWFFHPVVFWDQIAGIQKYYDVSQRTGIGESVVAAGGWGGKGFGTGVNGRKGTLYGIPAFTSGNVVSGLQTYRNLLLHKACFGFAVQTPGGQRARVQSDNLIQNIGTLTIVDILYGTKILREPAGVVVNANTGATTA